MKFKWDDVAVLRTSESSHCLKGKFVEEYVEGISPIHNYSQGY